jgi:hypothetical protein
MCSITMLEVYCTYIHFWKLIVSNHGVSTEAPSGCGRVSHVFSGMISTFVFDVLRIPSGCIQICSGWIAPTCTPCLWACFQVIGSFQVNKTSTGDQILNTRLLVNDEAEANTACSFRKNIRCKWHMIRSISIKICKTSSQETGVSKWATHAATKLLPLKA